MRSHALRAPSLPRIDAHTSRFFPLSIHTPHGRTHFPHTHSQTTNPHTHNSPVYHPNAPLEHIGEGYQSHASLQTGLVYTWEEAKSIDNSSRGIGSLLLSVINTMGK
jgi:hypothetical protein